ncbi:MAG TPA: hypothetical protein VIS74_04820 [Chthoniobacterales bacterium]
MKPRSLPFRIRAWAAPFILAALAGGALSAFGAGEFGSTESSETALIGTFYDLKQTQKLKPTGMGKEEYVTTLGAFLKDGWDESALNRFFRASQPLYTTQIFIPTMNADTAPKAFGVEKIVQPKMWLAHYKGQVVPPSTGRWRFWGMGDDILCVAVNGKIVLVNNWGGLRFPGIPWKSVEPGQTFGKGRLMAGDWMDLKAGEPVDLDILIGELPGVLFASFLLIEKQGESYEMVNGWPAFPIFQLAPYQTPIPTDPKSTFPRFAPDGPIWKGVQ